MPGWRAVIPFEQGAREIAEWYLADKARQVADASLDAAMDKLAAAWPREPHEPRDDGAGRPDDGPQARR